jgi:hypothetical protein
VLPKKEAVEAFHDVLAPVWHTEDEAQRETRACAALRALRVEASRLVSEPAPAKATPAFAAQARNLAQAVTALEAACEKDPAAVAAALHDVHEKFHTVRECSGD